jgi:fucose permease
VINTSKKSLFEMGDGRKAVLTFILVSSLFLLWGFCNGTIDVRDKHFQKELHLSLAQTARVQFAHYLDYFLPAGRPATTGGAIRSIRRGTVADRYDMSRGFIVPRVCFILIAASGYGWPGLSRAASLHGAGAAYRDESKPGN